MEARHLQAPGLHLLLQVSSARRRTRRGGLEYLDDAMGLELVAVRLRNTHSGSLELLPGLEARALRYINTYSFRAGRRQVIEVLLISVSGADRILKISLLLRLHLQLTGFGLDLLVSVLDSVTALRSCESTATLPARSPL